MAPRALSGPLAADAVREVLSRAASARVLPEVHLPLDEELDGVRAVSCFLLHHRENGFMIVVPGIPEAHAALEILSDAGRGEVPVFHAGTVHLETFRGRVLNVERVELPRWISHGAWRTSSSRPQRADLPCLANASPISTSSGSRVDGHHGRGYSSGST